MNATTFFDHGRVFKWRMWAFENKGQRAEDNALKKKKDKESLRKW
jgi:hypothetical protein